MSATATDWRIAGKEHDLGMHEVPNLVCCEECIYLATGVFPLTPAVNVIAHR